MTWESDMTELTRHLQQEERRLYIEALTAQFACLRWDWAWSTDGDQDNAVEAQRLSAAAYAKARDLTDAWALAHTRLQALYECRDRYYENVNMIKLGTDVLRGDPAAIKRLEEILAEKPGSTG